MTTIEPSVSGRRAGPPMPSIAEKLAFSIQEFCALHNISRGHYYALRKAGLGPAEMDAQGRRLISREAAEAWRRAREAAAQAEAAA